MDALRKLLRSPLAAGVLLTVGAIAMFFSIRSTVAPSATVPQYYYTDDDGKSYFKDTAERIVPFDHNGKPAVRAHVFKAKNGQVFVAWMERNTDKAAAILRRIKPEGKRPVPATAEELAELARGVEHRKVTDAKWSPGGSNGGGLLRGQMLKEIKGPDGSDCTELSEEEFPNR